MQVSDCDEGISMTDLEAVGPVRHMHPGSTMQLGLGSQHSSHY